MSTFVTADGEALVYCEGAFNTPNGKTAHGLVRFTRRYRVRGVIDSRYAGRDAGEVLDGVACDIPVYADLAAALEAAATLGWQLSYFVVGLAPDGGRLPAGSRAHVLEAINAGLNVDSGLHDFLSEDAGLAGAADAANVVLRDIRRPPPRSELHFFTGKIENVTSTIIAMLGTDSAVGKRTTAVKLILGLEEAGISAELIGTGQTSWMQGARYSVVVDSLVSDFMAGEIEHVVWLAWKEQGPDVIVLEGQGSLMNPAYPGGYELLSAGRPHAVVVQHAPARTEYDGFPGYPIHPLARQIAAIEMISDRPVIAVTVNHEGLDAETTHAACASITAETGLPAFDVLLDGTDELVQAVVQRLHLRNKR